MFLPMKNVQGVSGLVENQNENKNKKNEPEK